MLKLLLVFAIFIAGMLMLLVYFIGNYSVNFNYLTTTISGKVPPERNLVADDGQKDKSFYHLKVTTLGLVEFQKEDGNDRDYRTFKIEDKDVQTIRDKMESTGIFKLVTLDRTYCFYKFDATIYFDFGWLNKGVKYSNCNDDPSEVKEFRHFLYEFLGLSLKGT